MKIGFVDSVILAVVLIAWSVGMVAMTKMVLAGRKAGERWWLISPAVAVAQYNRKNLRIFAACVFVIISAIVVYNALFLMGYIKL